MAADAPQKKLRCAIYTRKSTTEKLDMDFNTLDAQREQAELFIRSQGWIIRPDRYDDGGFSGANIERPALKRLLKDLEDGKVDCVVVYKVDRLSRSLLDFARLIELFDAKGVSFVSTTQQFNTAQSLVDLDVAKLEPHLHDLAAPFPPLAPTEDDQDGDEAPEEAAS
jgi:site-specific DNA recombinase